MNTNDWDEVEEKEKARKNIDIQKYGMDISEHFKVYTSEKNAKKRLIRKKIIIVSFIILIILTIVYFKYEYNKVKYTQKVKDFVQINCSTSVVEKEKIVFISGNGFYTFQLEKNPDIIAHAYLNDITFETDINSRIYKYYFEKWNSSDKKSFIIDESYKDISYVFIKKKNWILNYKTYINVNNYNEMLEAFDKIYNFIKYMGDNSVLIESYIRFNNELILPHNVSIQTYEQMKEMSIRQYINIIKKYNLNKNDIPNDMIQKYWDQ